jgi:hypothetical protein
MKPSAELGDRIATLIRTYCGEGSTEPADLKHLAERHHVLPVLIDWSAFWGLRPDGDILLIPTEEGGGVQLEAEERALRIAIFRGVKKYPELEPLVPDRPGGAPDCPHCEGRGRIDILGVEPDNIVCYCGGLGWLTNEEALSEGRG